jgi:hypothetical protein
MSVSEYLDLEHRLAAAEAAIPEWNLKLPTGRSLQTRAEIIEALHGGSPGDNDRLLLRIAELANFEAGDSRDAAAVLASLVLPGVRARLALCAPGPVLGEVDRHAAAWLWIACRSFPYRTAHWVAMSIAWRVFRATQLELGRGHRRGVWAATVMAGDPHWWADDFVDPEPEPDVSDEWADLMLWASRNGVLTSDDEQFLATLIRLMSQVPDTRASRHGLLSRQVSEAMAVEVGMGESTVRRRVGQILNDLRAAGPAYLSQMAS